MTCYELSCSRSKQWSAQRPRQLPRCVCCLLSVLCLWLVTAESFTCSQRSLLKLGVQRNRPQRCVDAVFYVLVHVSLRNNDRRKHFLEQPRQKVPRWVHFPCVRTAHVVNVCLSCVIQATAERKADAEAAAKVCLSVDVCDTREFMAAQADALSRCSCQVV